MTRSYPLRATGVALMVAGGLLCVPAQAAESDSGLYGTLRLGAGLLQDMDFAESTTANLSLNPAAGWNLNGAFGYRFGNGLRTEIEIGYGRNSLSGQFQENVQVVIPCGTV